MFLHIGNNVIINTKDIIGIYQLESIENTKEYQEMVTRLKENHLLEEQNSNPKTFILAIEQGKLKGYLSNISSITLGKRARNENDIL